MIATIDPPAVLPLLDGERLTRREFERRYDAMPGVKKAELVEGVVSMPSPVSSDFHGDQHSSMSYWAKTYALESQYLISQSDVTVRLDDDNEPQPDVLLFIRPEAGGRMVKEDGYLACAPDLAIEIAGTTVAKDLGPKKTAYRRNEVREYIVWRVHDDIIHWFSLRDGQYELLVADAGGVVKSELFPGLWLDVPRMLAGDLKGVLATLARGLASPDHAAFVERLAAANRQTPVAPIL